LYSPEPKPNLVADAIEFYRERRDTFAHEEIDAPKGRGVTGSPIRRVGGRDRTDESDIEVEEGFFGEAQRRVGRGEPRPFVNTPPGLAGPLKIDFLKFTEEQKKNLEEAGPY
jgi:hypothetical protein